MAAGAQQSDEEVVVTARRAPQDLRYVIGSFSVVESGDLHDGRATINLDESLNRVPGVFIQNSGNFAQDTRLQIRGFGTRAAFGVREIRVLLDGLPETLPDGQTQLDEIDLDAIDRIEILRGPAASLYGNASGGVLQLFTKDAPQRPTLGVRFTGGSYGLDKYALEGGASSERARLYVHGSHLDINGFRDHSGARANTINGKLELDPFDKLSVAAMLDAVDSPKADDPGALTRAEANANPQQANAANLRFDAGESVQQGRVGSRLSYDDGSNSLLAYGYGLYRDFENKLAFRDGGVVTFNRFSPGGGVRYSNRFDYRDFRSTASIGVDVQYQDDNRRRYDNDLGRRGNLNLDQRERVLGVGPYFLEVLKVSEELELSAGVRYDLVDYDVDVDFDASGNDNSGSTSFHQWSPAGGVRYSPLAWTTLYCDVGTAFQVPTTTELAIPNRSGLDESLDPQTARSYEAGLRLLPAKRLSAGVAGFWIDIDDELVPFETEPGRTDFRNVGSSRRRGVELDWQSQLLDSLRWTGAFTYVDAKFRDYRINDAASGIYDDNHEPGIPPWQVFLELLYTHRSGLYAGLETFVVDSYFVDDANTTKSRRYELVNLRSGWSGEWNGVRLSPFISLNNLADQSYDGTVRINARGGRFFEPAPGLNIVAGIGVSASL